MGNDQNLRDLTAVLKEIEKKVLEHRAQNNGSEKNIKDYRRMFDQDSSRMNAAIFNDSPLEEIYQETLSTISNLIEILSRARKK